MAIAFLVGLALGFVGALISVGALVSELRLERQRENAIAEAYRKIGYIVADDGTVTSIGSIKQALTPSGITRRELYERASTSN